MLKRICVLCFVSIVLVRQSSAQGCSDAGVCTLHSIKNNTGGHESRNGKKNDVSVGFAYGKGERSTNNYTGYLEYTRTITNRTSVTGKLGYSFINGELANTNGFTDLFLSLNHAFDVNKKWQKSFVIGLKLPFDGADIIENGIHLPMPYQTSLGTTDLVLAINYNLKSFGATLALQHPLKAINKNKFLPGDYPDEPLALNYWP
ncbi:MAG TPA: hypothetical protein VFO37_05590, partial [Chitinophagaceae bacterium]|nr:hypothetical protein [Chitinophagaceae bacterium]